jgi:hypothetical protein
MEKISRTDRVRNEVLHRAKEEREIPRTVTRSKANWNDHMLPTNCLLQYVTEGMIGEGIDEEEDVRSYWMTLGKGEDTVHWKRKYWIALWGGFDLEEAVSLS